MLAACQWQALLQTCCSLQVALLTENKYQDGQGTRQEVPLTLHYSIMLFKARYTQNSK